MMRITVQLGWICEDDSIDYCPRVVYYEVYGLYTCTQVYEWCSTMIMEYVDSDYCYMRIYLCDEKFMDVDLAALRWAVEG